MASGTNGGTFTSGAWQIRPLNTVKVNEIPGASLASNQITLPPGTYYIRAAAHAGGMGMNAFADINTVSDESDSLVVGTFTITGTKTFELRHRCQTTKVGDGMGYAAGWGTEVYALIEIEKD